MTSKTKDEICVWLFRYANSDVSITDALAKICAIVDKEREGEVVLGDGVVNWSGDEMSGEYTVGGNWCKLTKYEGMTGRLIFVPDQEAK